MTLPNWQTSRPNWFPQEFAWTVGCTYLGMPRSRAVVRNIMGGNASYRRELFQQIDGFRNTIGRVRWETSARMRGNGIVHTNQTFPSRGGAPI